MEQTTVEVEFGDYGTLSVDVSFNVVKEDYGYDIDGNRGETRTVIEDIEIERVYDIRDINIHKDQADNFYDLVCEKLTDIERG